MSALPARLRRCVAAVRTMEENATPGPWRTGTPGPNRCPTIGTRGGLMVAMVAYGEDHPTESNAHLIVAARNSAGATCNVMLAVADQIERGEVIEEIIVTATAWCEAVEREYGVAEQRESEEAR